jgi:hypothetical protein
MLLAWIPVEVVMAYKAAMGSIPDDYPNLRFDFTVAAIILTVFWIAFATVPERSGEKKFPWGLIAWRQVMLAPIAFVFWAVATQGDVVKQVLPWWLSWMALPALAASAVVLPILNGILRACRVPQKAI